MIGEPFNAKLDDELIQEVWPEYYTDKNFIIENIGTNITSANKILSQILSDEEKSRLEFLLLSDKGWYKNTIGTGTIQLKLAAMSLGLTNDIFCFDQTRENRIKEELLSYSEFDQLLNAKCYLKQKMVTYWTMKTYNKMIKSSDDDFITVYRGINTPYDEQKPYYSFVGLESWTTNINTAKRFARGVGYVIQRDIPLSDLFITRRSTFKNINNNSFRNNGFYVRREHEVVVENSDRKFCCDGHTISLDESNYD